MNNIPSDPGERFRATAATCPPKPNQTTIHAARVDMHSEAERVQKLALDVAQQLGIEPGLSGQSASPVAPSSCGLAAELIGVKEMLEHTAGLLGQVVRAIGDR